MCGAMRKGLIGWVQAGGCAAELNVHAANASMARASLIQVADIVFPHIACAERRPAGGMSWNFGALTNDQYWREA